MDLRKVLANYARKLRLAQTHQKFKLVGVFSLLLLVTILCTRYNLSPPSSPPAEVPILASRETCNKIPPSLADAIVYYSTSKTIPQQTFMEISVSARVLKKKSPCNFLVFGLGHDSLMWASLNHGGRTVFLEEDHKWIDSIQRKVPSLESYHVVYNTKVSQAEELMQSARVEECTTLHEMRSSRCVLALREMPEFVYETEWDLIMVDAPTGYMDKAPGRMGAIYTAGMIARGRKEGETHVFVHDVDRKVEDEFSKAFLCEGYLTEQEGRLRHFTIPSHRTTAGIPPFCP